MVTWEPQRGADGSLGAGCFLGLEPLHQPQGTASPQAGRAGGLRLLAGCFMGAGATAPAPMKHPASMRIKQGAKQGSPKNSNIKQARNAREEAPKRVTWEPQRGADGSWLDDRG